MIVENNTGMIYLGGGVDDAVVQNAEVRNASKLWTCLEMRTVIL